VRQKATGFSPAPGAQRCTPCRPQQASPQRSRAKSPDKGIFTENPRERVSRAAAEGRRAECVCEAESELESVSCKGKNPTLSAASASASASAGSGLTLNPSH